MLIRRMSACVAATLASIILVSTASAGAPASHGPVRRTKVHMMKSGADEAARQAALVASTALSPNLEYGGGPIIESAEIYTVYWGSDVPQSTIARIDAMYGAVAGPQSPYFEALAEYDTSEPQQTVGFGSFRGSLVDSDAPNVTYVTDVEIQAELARLIDAGELPPQNGHNIFMVYLPPSIVVDATSPGGDPLLSCQVWCGYHGYFDRNGSEVRYAVMPTCGPNICRPGDEIDSLVFVSTHELTEAVTDPEGSGWFDPNGFGEVADICQPFPSENVRGSNVTKIWSNEDQGCRAHDPKTSFSITVSPFVKRISAGGTATFTISASGTSKKPATLGLLNWATGVTPSFDQTSLLAGQQAHLTFTAGSRLATGGAYSYVVAHDENDEYHFALPELALVGDGPSITAVSPAVGTSQGIGGVKITGTNLNWSTRVRFGDETVFAQSVAPDGTWMTVHTPSEPVGLVDVTVASWLGQVATLPLAYRVTQGPAPGITSIIPASGPADGGYFIVAIGTNFSTSNPPVFTIGGVPTYSVTWDSTYSEVYVPPGSLGPVDIAVTNGDGQSATAPFTYAVGFDGGGAPLLSGLGTSRGSSSGNTYVSIYGMNFDSGARVYFGGVEAHVDTNNPFFLGVVTGPHAPGVVDVEVVNSDASAEVLSLAYTYQ